MSSRNGKKNSGAAYVFDLPVCIAEPEFIRGDGNGDGLIDIADPIYNLAYLFNEGQTVCLDAQDTNDDAVVDIADPIYWLTYQFSSGPAPPDPFPGCGTDPTDDALGCLDDAACP